MNCASNQELIVFEKVYAQETPEDEEAGCARLEDIFSGQSGQASTLSR